MPEVPLLHAPDFPHPENTCRLCGFPANDSFKKETDGESLSFCCRGCAHVYEILLSRPDGGLENFQESALYRTLLSAGIIRQTEETISTGGPSKSVLPDWESELAEEEVWTVEGMWCPSCAYVVEAALAGIPGILETAVSFVTDSIRIRYLPHRVRIAEVPGTIEPFGYRMRPFSAPEEDRVKKDLLIRFGFSSILTLNIMMISFSLYWGFFGILDDSAVTVLSYPIFLMGTVVVFYGGFPILKNGWRSFKNRAMTMDTLISAGALAAYIHSLFHLYRGSLHLYFDTAAMLISLVLLGRLIDMQIRRRITASLDVLSRLSRQKVRLVQQKQERWTSPDGVQPGAVFKVLKGETIAIDGRLESRSARLDESILTGESRPVIRKVGQEVNAGSRLLDGEILLRAVRTGKESTVGRMIALIREAMFRKNASENLADRITRRLVPFVLLLSAGTAVFWTASGLNPDEALQRAVTVLVITCPCALGIAVPLTKVAAIAAGRAKGVLIRSHDALEKVKDLDTLILDKTGTVTEGRFSLRHIHPAFPDIRDVLKRLAAVESHSGHYLAGEIVRYAAESGVVVEKATQFRDFPGMGVSGMVQGEELFAGNRHFMDRQGFSGLAPHLETLAATYARSGMTLVFFGWQESIRGFAAFGDHVRTSSRSAIWKLRKRGLDIRLLSGDSTETTAAVARDLGIDHFTGHLLPGGKADIIHRLRAEGHRIGMVGDGINDAPALSEADVGFAVGTRTDLVQSASDITLLSMDLSIIDDLFRLSALSSRVLHQNLFFAFLYNILGIPLAVAGMLNPLVAVSAMFAGSLTVIGNTLRIRNRRAKTAGPS